MSQFKVSGLSSHRRIQVSASVSSKIFEVIMSDCSLLRLKMKQINPVTNPKPKSYDSRQ
jgi:hypothetical protein